MNIGIIGASGVVGMELIKLLEKNHLNINYSSVLLFGSERSVGKQIKFKDELLTINLLTEDIFKNLTVVIFCTGDDVSNKYIPIAIQKDCVCIDHSTNYRMNPQVPLVIPEINSFSIPGKNIIASPNCCTTMLCMVLFPLLELSNIEWVNVCTYQAASGAGIKGLNELKQQIRDYSNGNKLKTDYFKRQYLLNVFSHNSDLNAINGFNEEEIKIMEETKKILNVKVNPTCVRVPVLRSHCESVTIKFKSEVDLLEIHDKLATFPGVSLQDDKIQNKFPEPIDTENTFDIKVGRIRYSICDEENAHKVVNLFLSGDQLLKGAALNSYQILSYV